MSEPSQDYFALTHDKPKSGLLNRRQQHANYLQPLEMPSLPPLSQLLPTDTKVEEQIAFAQPQMMYDYSNAAAAAAAAAAVATTTTTTTNNHPATSLSTALPNPNVYSLGDPSLNQNPELVAAAVSMMNFDPIYIPQSGPPTVMPLMTQKMGDYPPRSRQASNASHSSAEKIYSFVEIPGTNQKKRPRRRYDEIERLYHCNWPECHKAYGTLNHLNAHVSMQKHGPKRNPSEFKEMRKEWRKQKKERETVRKNEHQVKQEMISAFPLSNFNPISANPMSLHGFY